MIRLPALASILLIFLIACGSSSNARIPEAAPDGWKTLTVAQMKIAVPGTYSELSAADRQVQAQDGAQLASNVLLAANEPTGKTSINVAKTTLPSGNWKNAFDSKTLNRAGIQLIDRQEVELAAGDAIRLITRVSSGSTVIASIQYYFPFEKDLWTVTYVATNDVFQANIATFDQSARTIAMSKN